MPKPKRLLWPALAAAAAVVIIAGASFIHTQVARANAAALTDELRQVISVGMTTDQIIHTVESRSLTYNASTDPTGRGEYREMSVYVGPDPGPIRKAIETIDYVVGAGWTGGQSRWVLIRFDPTGVVERIDWP